MKINEIIRKKRIEKGLTQEQLASHLGISAPAVNKWEKAVSYPDITLLPALARLLDTDLNTLLSFQEDLNEQEITGIITELVSIFNSDGVEPAFCFGMDQIHEYPNCDNLILNTALALEGLVTMYSDISDNRQHYLDSILQLYVRVSKSPQTETANLAKSMLISRYINNNEFENAELLLEQLPTSNELTLDKKQLKVRLHFAQGNLNEAARLTEQKMISSLSTVNLSLSILMEIAVQEEQPEDARKILAIIKKMTALFDLWSYNSYSAQFQFCVMLKNAPDSLAALKKMYPILKQTWNPTGSPLYRHIPIKERVEKEQMGEMLFAKIMTEIEDYANQQYDFLRDYPPFGEFAASIKDSTLTDTE